MILFSQFWSDVAAQSDFKALPVLACKYWAYTGMPLLTSKYLNRTINQYW